MSDPTPSSINHDPSPAVPPTEPAPQTETRQDDSPARNGCSVRPSATRATVGRIVLVHSSHLTSPSPGIVVQVDENGSVLVNTFLNGISDPAALDAVRKSGAGNTMGPMEVYDALDEPQRCFLQTHYALDFWAEWMPYQVGQARKTEEATDSLRRMLSDIDRRLAAVEAHFGTASTPAVPST